MRIGVVGVGLHKGQSQVAPDPRAGPYAPGGGTTGDDPTPPDAGGRGYAQTLLPDMK